MSVRQQVNHRALAATNPVAVQAPVKGQGVSGLSTRYACSKCAISYDVPTTDKPACPMCRLERETKLLMLKLREAEETIANQNERLKSLAAQVDAVQAIRDAVDITGHEDLAWLKAVMYRYRQDRSLSLIATAATFRNRRMAAPRGVAKTAFMLVERGQENEEYRPTSVGGAAILGFYDEMYREVGAQKAMGYLLRALSPTLVGGRPE